jgi:DNA-directed RNA polymerase specialized sigma subunit
MSAENKEGAEAGESPELEDVAENEHHYLHERLRQELAREPTEEELNEWLRQHTEGY